MEELHVSSYKFHILNTQHNAHCTAVKLWLFLYRDLTLPICKTHNFKTKGMPMFGRSTQHESAAPILIYSIPQCRPLQDMRCRH